MENVKRKTGMPRLFQLAGMQKGLVVSSGILSVLSALANFLPFIAIYFIIAEILTNITDLSGVDSSYLITLGWIAAGGVIAAVLLNFIALMCSHMAAFKTLYRLKLDFVTHLASLPLGFHSKNATGKLRKIVDQNIEKLESFIAHQLPDLIGSLATPIFMLIILFTFDWRLGLASLVPVIIAYVCQMLGYGRKGAKDFMSTYQNSLEDMNNAAVEYVRGISVVKAFNQTVFSFRKFYETIRSYTHYTLEYTNSFENYYGLFVAVLNNVYLFIMPVIILLAGGTDNYLQFALSSIFYLIFSVSIPGAIMKLLYVASSGTQIVDGVERMDKILDVKPLSEVVNGRKTSRHNIVFDDVSFSYEKDAENAIYKVSFEAKPGEITALVGPSGSGKSTIAHLIPRFYDVDSGVIKIGDVDIREIGNEDLMEKVSFVFQDVFLFKQSVLENIAIGDEKATREDVIKAAKAARCHDFIEKLPEGYDTVIGTKGIHLSGGEKQRIIIARAILKDAPILILDEATAFADPENEYQIQQAFEELMKDKTVLIIAHRLSTIRGAAKIIVLEEGKIAEEGTHEELLEKKGRYEKMWSQYTKSIDWTLGEKEGGRQNA